MFGYRGRSDWRDMSDYVVHFVRGGQGDTGYGAVMSILWDGRIRAGGPWGAARNLSEVRASQMSACLSEVPIDLLNRLTQRRQTSYGIAFKKQLLLERGGGRVWYVDRSTPAEAAFSQLVRAAMQGGVDSEDPIWRLTPFVDSPTDRYRFEWEREWRVPGGLDFCPDDVEFLFIPAELHDSAEAFFSDVKAGNSGPAYECPFIDPRWDGAQISDRLPLKFQPREVAPE